MTYRNYIVGGAGGVASAPSQFSETMIASRTGVAEFTITALSESYAVVTNPTNSIESVVSWTGTLTCDLTTIGVGGLDQGALGNTRFYYVYLISDSAGVVDVIAALDDETTPVIPAGYSISVPLFCVRSNAAGTDIEIFRLAPSGWCEFTGGLGLLAGTGLVATVLTPIDLTNFAPGIPASPTLMFNDEIRIHVVAQNTNTSSRTFFMRYNASEDFGMYWTGMGSQTGGQRARSDQVDVPGLRGLARTTAINYEWDLAPTTGSLVYMRALKFYR